jgi:hypothetical protein
MYRLSTLLIGLFFGLTSIQAQQDVTIHVTDAGTNQPIENAFVSMDNMFMNTDYSTLRAPYLLKPHCPIIDIMLIDILGMPSYKYNLTPSS